MGNATSLPFIQMEVNGDRAKTELHPEKAKADWVWTRSAFTATRCYATVRLHGPAGVRPPPEALSAPAALRAHNSITCARGATHLDCGSGHLRWHPDSSNPLPSREQGQHAPSRPAVSLPCIPEEYRVGYHLPSGCKMWQQRINPREASKPVRGSLHPPPSQSAQ